MRGKLRKVKGDPFTVLLGNRGLLISPLPPLSNANNPPRPRGWAASLPHPKTCQRLCPGRHQSNPERRFARRHSNAPFLRIRRTARVLPTKAELKSQPDYSSVRWLLERVACPEFLDIARIPERQVTLSQFMVQNRSLDVAGCPLNQDCKPLVQPGRQRQMDDAVMGQFVGQTLA